MIIDFSEKILSIKNASLASNQKSQLYDWGFRSDGENLFELSRGNTEKTILKVIRYFEKINVKIHYLDFFPI